MAGFEDNPRDAGLNEDGFRKARVAVKAETDFNHKIANDPEHKKLGLKVNPSKGF